MTDIPTIIAEIEAALPKRDTDDMEPFRRAVTPERIASLIEHVRGQDSARATAYSIIRECVAALGTGAFISAGASDEFHTRAPIEIRVRIALLEARIVELMKERDTWRGSSCAMEALVRENDDKIDVLESRIAELERPSQTIGEALEIGYLRRVIADMGTRVVELSAQTPAARKPRPGIFVDGVPISDCPIEVQAEACRSIDRRMRGEIAEKPPHSGRPQVNIRDAIEHLDRAEALKGDAP